MSAELTFKGIPDIKLLGTAAKPLQEIAAAALHHAEEAFGVKPGTLEKTFESTMQKVRAGKENALKGLDRLKQLAHGHDEPVLDTSRVHAALKAATDKYGEPVVTAGAGDKAQAMHTPAKIETVVSGPKK